jgi:hypothetical protein
MNGVDLELVIGSLAASADAQFGRQRSAGWTQQEDDFIRKYLGWLTDKEIGDAIGRSELAVRVHWKRKLQLTSPSKSPDLITANRISLALGMSDCHAVTLWVDFGMLPGRMMAGARNIRLVSRVSFLRWATTPDNWIYFKIDRVRDPHLKRLIELRRQQWNDEWWTLRQAADYLNVDIDKVQLAAKHGRLKTVQPKCSLSGRHLTRAWSNHFVLRSEATRPDLTFPTRKDSNRRIFTPRAQAWIVHAHDDLGLKYEEICRTMKLNLKKTSHLGYYYHRIKEEKR